MAKDIEVRYRRWLFLILALALLLRVPGLFKSINPDEIFLVGQSWSGPEHILTKQWSYDIHPPLNFLFAYYWMKGGDSDWWLRLPSLIASLLTLYLLFNLATKLFGPTVGLTATALMAAAPFSVLYSTWAKHYPILVLLSIISFKSCYHGIKGDRRWWWVFIPANLLGLYWHYSMFLILAAENVLFLVAKIWLECGISWRNWVLVNLCIFMGFLLWLPIFWDQVASGRDITTGSPLVDVSRLLKVPFFFYAFSLGESISPWEILPVAIGAVIFAILFIGGILRLMRKERVWGIAILTLFFVPFAIGSLRRVTVPKHLYIIFPFYCLILSAYLSSLGSKRLKSLLLVVILGLWSYSLFNFYGNRSFFDGSLAIPWKQIANQIHRRMHPNDVVLIYPYGVSKYFRYYYGDDGRQITIDPSDDKGLADQLRNLPPFRNLWAILHYGGSEETERQREFIKRHLGETYELVEEESYVRDEHLTKSLAGIFAKRGARPYTLIELCRFRRGRD